MRVLQTHTDVIPLLMACKRHVCGIIARCCDVRLRDVAFCRLQPASAAECGYRSASPILNIRFVAPCFAHLRMREARGEYREAILPHRASGLTQARALLRFRPSTPRLWQASARRAKVAWRRRRRVPAHGRLRLFP